jgi:hypothetical protein
MSSGGTNIDTGLPFKGLMKAPVGSQFITPLTSLMADSGLTAAEVVAALGLPNGTDVTRLDPISNLELQKKRWRSSKSSSKSPTRSALWRRIHRQMR